MLAFRSVYATARDTWWPAIFIARHSFVFYRLIIINISIVLSHLLVVPANGMRHADCMTRDPRPLLASPLPLFQPRIKCRLVLFGVPINGDETRRLTAHAVPDHCNSQRNIAWSTAPGCCVCMAYSGERLLLVTGSLTCHPQEIMLIDRKLNSWKL